MKHKILIADDDENIRLPLQYAFAEYTVLIAGDGLAAAGIIAAERPSVVLLDLSMPLMSGLEVLAALEVGEDRPLVIVLTGNDQIDMARKALELGAASYITKPVDIAVIRRVVLAALADRERGKKTDDKPWRIKKDGE